MKPEPTKLRCGKPKLDEWCNSCDFYIDCLSTTSPQEGKPITGACGRTFATEDFCRPCVEKHPEKVKRCPLIQAIWAHERRQEEARQVEKYKQSLGYGMLLAQLKRKEQGPMEYQQVQDRVLRCLMEVFRCPYRDNIPLWLKRSLEDEKSDKIGWIRVDLAVEFGIAIPWSSARAWRNLTDIVDFVHANVKDR